MIKILSPEFEMEFFEGDAVKNVLSAIWKRYQKPDRNKWVLEIRIGDERFLFNGDGGELWDSTLEEMIKRCTEYLDQNSLPFS